MRTPQCYWHEHDEFHGHVGSVVLFFFLDIWKNNINNVQVCVCVCVKEAFQNPPNLGGDHFVMVELKDKKYAR